jgi:hypothetical protein
MEGTQIAQKPIAPQSTLSAYSFQTQIIRTRRIIAECCFYTIIHEKYNIFIVTSSSTCIYYNLQCVPLATEPGISGWLADGCSVSQQLGALHTHSSSFLTQRTYSCSNFVAISSLVLELLTLWRRNYFRLISAHPVYKM